MPQHQHRHQEQLRGSRRQPPKAVSACACGFAQMRWQAAVRVLKLATQVQQQQQYACAPLDWVKSLLTVNSMDMCCATARNHHRHELQPDLSCHTEIAGRWGGCVCAGCVTTQHCPVSHACLWVPAIGCQLSKATVPWDHQRLLLAQHRNDHRCCCCCYCTCTAWCFCHAGLLTATPCQ